MQRACDDACERWSRARDGWETIKFVLAHDQQPADSVVVNEAGSLRSLTYQGARSADMPTIVVVYRWSRTDVTIVEARFSAAVASFSGRA